MVMAAKKAYLIAVVILLIYTGMFVFSKAAFNHGINTYVFIFYRMAAASLFLLPIAIALQRKNVRSMSVVLLLRLFFYALVGNTFSLNLYNVSMKMTTATVASASSNSMPVITFCLALLLRMEAVRLRTTPGVAKATGVALCLAGVLVLAFYAGPALSPVNHHRAFAVSGETTTPSRVTWIKGTLPMVLANATWALWIVVQLIYTGMFVFSKAAFDHGINTYVYIFYRMAAALLFLLPIAIALQRNTFSVNAYNVSIKLTTATLASASSNSLPVITFCLALLLRMEAVRLRTTVGVAKVAGVELCLAGVLVLRSTLDRH